MNILNINKLIEHIRKPVFAIELLFICSIFALAIAPKTASAAFNPNNIISDSTLSDYNTMSEAQIQQFLVDKGSFLAGYTIPAGQNKNYYVGLDAQGNEKWVTSYINPWIGPVGSEVNSTGWPVSRVIYMSAQWYKINPQVILSIMQKESSMVGSSFDRTGPYYFARMAWVMGYAYTESSDPIKNVCHSDTNFNPTNSCAGVAMQVDWAAGSLVPWMNNANAHTGNSFGCDTNGDGSSDRWGNYWANTTFQLCDGTWVSPQNGVTAAFYRYTPHNSWGGVFYITFTSWFENWDLQSGLMYTTGPNRWNAAATKFLAAADYNGDGRRDIAAMYDYGNGNMGIWSFESDGNTLVPKLMLLTGPNMWNTSATKFMVAGDFNRDGYDDLAAMYDYGNGKMAIWSFESAITSMNPRAIYMGSNGNWNTSATKFMVTGDFNNDDTKDIAAMYDYGNGKMGIWAFESNRSILAPRSIYMGSNGNWNTTATKFMVAGDFNNDGIDDAAAIYDYGAGKMGIWSFESNGVTMAPRAIYTGAPGNWDISATKFVAAGDHNNDGIADITAMYDYGSSKMGFWSFNSNGSQLTPVKSYMNYGWNTSSTKFLLSGKFDASNKDSLVAFYDYGNSNMGLWAFTYKR